jgi:hypothetical protein
MPCVATLLWSKCENETHTPEIGTWESSGTPKISEFNCRGQNTSHWGVLYIIGKLLKFRCRKWPCIGHLDIWSTSYDIKKGRESNWQFDSRPLKIRNRPNPCACRWNATHRWKSFEERYNFALDLIPIGGLSKELWSFKVLGVQTGTVSGLLLRSPKTKSHLDVGSWRGTEYTIWGKVVASPKFGPWWVQSHPWLVLPPRVLQNVNYLTCWLVWCRFE